MTTEYDFFKNYESYLPRTAHLLHPQIRRSGKPYMVCHTMVQALETADFYHSTQFGQYQLTAVSP